MDLPFHGVTVNKQMVRASNRYLEGHGFDSRWRAQKIYFLINFDLRTLLHLFHFIQVTISRIINLSVVRLIYAVMVQGIKIIK